MFFVLFWGFVFFVLFLDHLVCVMGYADQVMLTMLNTERGAGPDAYLALRVLRRNSAFR